MNFRQRVAWLAVFIYVSCTCAVMYYIFEITDSYNEYAVDHVDKYHNNDPDQRVQEMLNAHIEHKGHSHSESGDEHDLKAASASIIFRYMWHVTDIPLAFWMLLLTLPYLQVFCMLLACTKPEPRFSLAYIWPIYVYFRCRNWYRGVTGTDLKAYNSPMPNGHTLLNT